MKEMVLDMDTITREMMTTEENGHIAEKAFNIIVSNMDVAGSECLSLDNDFLSRGLGSLAFIKIILALESEFNFEFEEEMLIPTKFSTIGDMVNYSMRMIAS